jgi:hypothetical protein
MKKKHEQLVMFIKIKKIGFFYKLKNQKEFYLLAGIHASRPVIRKKNT